MDQDRETLRDALQKLPTIDHHYRGYIVLVLSGAAMIYRLRPSWPSGRSRFNIRDVLAQFATLDQAKIWIDNEIDLESRVS